MLAASTCPPFDPTPCAEEQLCQLGDAELVRVARRVHSRLTNIECDCYVYESALPERPDGAPIANNSFFWRLTVHPITLRFLSPPGSPCDQARDS
jgi:hypothetical protein